VVSVITGVGGPLLSDTIPSQYNTNKNRYHIFDSGKLPVADKTHPNTSGTVTTTDGPEARLTNRYHNFYYGKWPMANLRNLDHLPDTDDDSGEPHDRLDPAGFPPSAPPLLPSLPVPHFFPVPLSHSLSSSSRDREK